MTDWGASQSLGGREAGPGKPLCAWVSPALIAAHQGQGPHGKDTARLALASPPPYSLLGLTGSFLFSFCFCLAGLWTTVAVLRGPWTVRGSLQGWLCERDVPHLSTIS